MGERIVRGRVGVESEGRRSEGDSLRGGVVRGNSLRGGVEGEGIVRMRVGGIV